MTIVFQWHKFNEIFPFADLERSQGEYANAVETCLEQLTDSKNQEILLDLLDLQWMARLEQIWISNEKSGETDYSADTVAARLQINSNIRRDYSLRASDPGSAMRNLGSNETLTSRLLESLDE